jgi:hypothetical protein
MSEPDDRELDRRVERLPRSMRPERDLWTDIAARIGAPEASASPAARRRKIVFAGAATVVALAAGVTLFARRPPGPSFPWPSPVPTAVAIASAPPAPSARGYDPLDAAKERAAYRAAVLALEASFTENRRHLSSEAAQKIERSLGILDHAIDATERALAVDPDSAELRLQLWDEYQQKIDALSVVVDLVSRTS